MSYQPPFKITSKILTLVAEISEQIGTLTASLFPKNYPARLRRANTIKSVQASCAIEGNELSIDQVSAILEGKTVIGSPREIMEVKNALDLYETINTFNPYSTKDLLSAHKKLMKGLIDNAGKYRNRAIGIKKGEDIVHLAHSAQNVTALVNNLFNWMNNNDLHPLIISSVFHYEFEFIHPFSDGNGRMGRFWQTLLLKSWKPIFRYIPIETVVKNNQEEYYNVLNVCNHSGESTIFIEFILKVIKTALKGIYTDQVSDYVSDQVKELVKIIGNYELSVAECMKRLNLKHRHSFRKSRLKPALEKCLIEMIQPDSPNSPGQKYRLTIKGKKLINNN